MHEIIFYKNSKGKEPILEYMQEFLSVYGTEHLPENYVKHLDGDIWELRPLMS